MDRAWQGLLKAVRRKWSLLALAAIVVAQCALSATFIAKASPTFDEPVHLCGGLDYLRNFRFGINPESGLLPQAWTALPLVGVPFHSLGSSDLDNFIAFYNKDVHPALESFGMLRTYWAARAMTAALNVACGLLLFFLARRLAGRVPALLALCVYAFSPLMISNGSLVTADMAATLFFFAVCASCWLMFRRVSAKSIAIAGLCLGALFLSKMSAPLALPALACFALLKAFSGSKVSVKLPSFARQAKGRFLKLAVCAASLFAAGLVAWGSVWAAYGFRYAMEAKQSQLVDSLRPSPTASALRLARNFKLMPEAYIHGMAKTLLSSNSRWSFLNGKVQFKGDASFFPLAFVMKTPPGALLAILSGLVAAGFLAVSRLGRARLFHLLPFLVFCAIYLFTALSGHLNIGVRHLMPAIPPLLLLAALGFRWTLRTKIAKPLPFLLAGACAVEAVAASPSQLAYFSPLFGGRSQAYKHLVDSSLDWGQDLGSLKKALEDAGLAPSPERKAYLAYFGYLDGELCGFKATVLPCYPECHEGKEPYEPGGGVYCFSATQLQGISSSDPLGQKPLNKAQLRRMKRLYFKPPSGPLSEIDRRDRMDFELRRLDRLRSALKEMKPRLNVGGSILVFALDDAQVREILGEDFLSDLPARQD